MMKLYLTDDLALERSEVVANSTMNRERGLTGTNSYSKDLSFDILAFLEHRIASKGEAAWLDLCCGSGKALIQAAHHFDEHEGGNILIQGVDLVPMSDSIPLGLTSLTLTAASLSTWQPNRRYDLITCVHGLHYIGDKLGVRVSLFL